MFKEWEDDLAQPRAGFNGEILTIPNSEDGYLRKLKLYGKSVQNGEPTPDNPVEIKTVPSEFDITSCGENLTPYLGTTTPITLRDTEGKLHYPASLPDGTRDEADLDGGESVERVNIATLDGTIGVSVLAQNTANTTYFQIPTSDVVFNSTAIVCSHFKHAIIWNTDAVGVWIGGSGAINFRLENSYLGINSTDELSVKIDKFKAWLAAQKAAGTPITTLYKISAPKVWHLHPDEQKKIITVDSDTAYIYTNAEVQPEISANAISY